MTRSLRSLEGYLMQDHSACLGGQKLEFGILTCSHCERQVVLNPERERARNHCRKCHAYVCDAPACNAECNGGYKAMLDELQEQAFKTQRLIGF